MLFSKIFSNFFIFFGRFGVIALATFLEPYIKRAVYAPEVEHATAGEIAESALEGIFFSALLDGGLKALESADGLGEMVKSKTAPAQKDGAADPAKLNQIEENLFAEIERDWYENEEKPAGKEKEEDDWEDIFGEEEGSVVESEQFRDIMGLQFFANKGIKKQSDQQLEKSIGSWEKNIELHRGKIINPKDFDEAWELKTEKQKIGLIKHWEKEIRNFAKNIEDARKELNERKIKDDH